MKHFKILSSIAAATLLSANTFAEPVVLDAELKLVGFSGGKCSISVAASANASNLDLDAPAGTNVSVGTLNSNCDYDHRIVASYGSSTAAEGYPVLTHSDGVTTVPIDINVDGFALDTALSEQSLSAGIAGMSSSLPIDVATYPAPVPGIYQGAVTFSLIID